MTNSIGQPLAPGTKVNVYTIQKAVSGSHLGLAYQAQDDRLRRTVWLSEYFPLKLARRSENLEIIPLSPEAEPLFFQGLAAIVKEAQLLANFNHPNIVQLLDYFELNGTIYTAAPILEGQSLASRLAALPQGEMIEAEVWAWLEPISAGLSQVHQKGGLHLDLNPDNIWLLPGGEPIIINFASVRQTLPQLGIKNKTGYASLEQISGKPGQQGPWTDLYALGATAIRCLTGLEPAAVEDRHEALVNDTPDPLKPALDKLMTASPPNLVQAVTGCLELYRKGRLSSLADFLSILRPAPAVQPSFPSQPLVSQPPAGNIPPQSQPGKPDSAKLTQTPQPAASSEQSSIKSAVFTAASADLNLENYGLMPASPALRKAMLILLWCLPLLVVLPLVYFYLNPQLPGCHDSVTTDLVTDIYKRELSKRFSSELVGKLVFNYDEITFEGVNSATGKLSCTAKLTVINQSGQENTSRIEYNIKHTDKYGSFTVEVRNQ
jgi:serine/threonine protein kinase